MISPFAARRSARPLLRGLSIAALAVLLGACNQTFAPPAAKLAVASPPQYAALSNERFAVPAVEADAVASQFLKQQVRYATEQQPGTVVIDPANKFLYLVLEDGKAMRYGIGVGREGFGWSGTAEIRRKASWPTWTPPASMIKRQPELEPYRRGMQPGIDNPLGARALYLYQNGKDTLYRIHGTNDPGSIGSNVSSGCVRLINQDVIDLFNRLPVGTKVVVLPDARRTAPSVRLEPAAADAAAREG
jgi:lipoprotein-anchoring transpeptidase ErfK/SrfK